MNRRPRKQRGLLRFRPAACPPSLGVAENVVENRRHWHAGPDRADRGARGAARRAQGSRGAGIYEDSKTGRWFIVMRLPSGEQTTRRRAADGRPLFTRDQAVKAKGEWRARFEAGRAVVGRERFDALRLAYVRAAKAQMSDGAFAAVRTPRRPTGAALSWRHPGQPLEQRRARGLARGHVRARRGTVVTEISEAVSFWMAEAELQLPLPAAGVEAHAPRDRRWPGR